MNARIPAALVLCFLAAGCAAINPVPYVPKTPLLEGIDARLLQKCEPQPVDVVIQSEDDIYKAHGDDTKRYATCADRHNALATELEKLKLTPAAPAP